MKIHLSRKWKIFLILLAIPLGVGAWLAAAPVRGFVVAHWDIARGHYEVQSFGLPAEWRPIYARILKEKYGVTHKVVAGCVVTPWLVGYVRSYNSVSKQNMNGKFGKDIFEESANLAQLEYNQNIK